MSRTDRPDPGLHSRLAYLLKHARLRMADLTAKALAPFGIDGRELAALLVLSGPEPISQQQSAQRLGIDRTTMVAMLDTLEGKGLVSRHPDADDRRRNVLELTDTGRDIFRRATKAYEEAERQFLAPLSPQAVQQLMSSLQALITPTDRDHR